LDTIEARAGAPVIVAAYGGVDQAAVAVIVRRFVEYWEYLLEDAIYTAPAHPNFGGRPC
jgi:predicted PP-loop superfamily ATPase